MDYPMGIILEKFADNGKKIECYLLKLAVIGKNPTFF